MAGPGIARATAAPAPGVERETTYDSRWVKPREPDAINTLNGKQQLSVDISKRELGARSKDMDGEIGGKKVPAYEQRQHDRAEARRKAWQARMGLETINTSKKDDGDDKGEGSTLKPRDRE